MFNLFLPHSVIYFYTASGKFDEILNVAIHLISDRIQPWDRLTSINGIDLTNMTKNEAIEVIKGAKSPMRFVVQAVIFVENFDKPSLLSKHISDDGVSENESQ